MLNVFLVPRSNFEPVCLCPLSEGSARLFSWMCTFLRQQRADFDGGGTAGELQSKNHSWLTVGDWPSQHPFYIYSVLWLNRLGYPVWDEFESTMVIRLAPLRTRPDHSSSGSGPRRGHLWLLACVHILIFMFMYLCRHLWFFQSFVWVAHT